MKKKSLISLVLVLVMVATMCVCPISASAATVENTTTESVGTEDGWSYVEFTVTKSYSARTVYTDTVYPLPTTFFPGETEMKADGDHISVAARGTNLGVTVSIQIYVKVSGNLYNPVSHVEQLVCNGKSYNLFSGFEVNEGSTYRFYYRLDGNTTAQPTVILAASFWSY